MTMATTNRSDVIDFDGDEIGDEAALDLLADVAQALDVKQDETAPTNAELRELAAQVRLASKNL